MSVATEQMGSENITNIAIDTGRNQRGSPNLASQDIDIRKHEQGQPRIDLPDDFEIEDVLALMAKKADREEFKALEVSKTNK